MEVIFEIEYRVEPNQQLWIDGDITAPMTSIDGEKWSVNLELAPREFSYSYLVRTEGDVVRKEEGGDHTLAVKESVELIHKVDCWALEPESRPLSSALFTKSVFRRVAPKRVELKPNTTFLECYCPRVEPHQSLVVVGVSKEFGHWDASCGLIMADGDFPMWRVAIDQVKSHTEYKFAIVDTLSREVVAWESGENRMLVPNDTVNQTDG